MPDDDRRFSVPSPAPERIDLASIKTDLEFAIDQLVRLHRQIARTALGIIFCTAVVTICTAATSAPANAEGTRPDPGPTARTAPAALADNTFSACAVGQLWVETGHWPVPDRAWADKLPLVVYAADPFGCAFQHSVDPGEAACDCLPHRDFLRYLARLDIQIQPRKFPFVLI